MKKYINTLTVLAVLYILVYCLNILFIVANYTALMVGRSASLSFGSQLSFAAWGLPAVIAITATAFLLDAGYISFNSSKK